MKNLTPAAVALAMATAGCFGAGEGDLIATWTITVNGQASTCAAVGAGAVQVHAQRHRDKLEYTESIPCGEGGVTLVGFRPGTYDVDVSLLDTDGKVLSDPFALEVDIFSGDVTDIGNVEFAFDSGRFTASWVITVNGDPVTCEYVGAGAFQVVSQRGDQQYVDTALCTAGAITTDPLPVGSYVVSVSLLDTNGAILNSAPVTQNVELGRAETKNLGEFEFAFSFRNASFKVHMGTAQVLGGNCNSTNPDGGAGVVAEELSVVRTDTSQCIKLDVTGIFDAQGAPTLGSTCTSYRCQYEEVVRTIVNMQIGEYTLRARGYRTKTNGQAVLCYESAPIAFSMGTSDVDLGTIAAPPTGDPACK